MASRRAVAVLSCLLLASTGCSKEEHEAIPLACRQGTDTVRAALKSAPAPVSLEGVPLSACLGDESDSGELRDVGTAYLDAAAGLAAAAEERPNGAAATQLGYLMGAVRRGTATHQGVNAEMVRRLEQELLRIDTRSEAFRRGLEAGRRGG